MCYYSRKGALVVSDVLGSLGSIMLITCVPMHSVITLILGRFVVGFSSGMHSSVCTCDAFNAGCPFENLIMLEFYPVHQNSANGNGKLLCGGT